MSTGHKIVVIGGAGVLGRAIVTTLKQIGHQVVTAGRKGCDYTLDLRYDTQLHELEGLVQGAHLVVNAAGILIERGDNTYEAVHVEAVRLIAQACIQTGVKRLVHISALGVGTGIKGQYMRSKLVAEHAIINTLTGSTTDFAIIRPALLVDSACPSTRLFKMLSGLPIIALPDVKHPGQNRVAPIMVNDVAECVARIGMYNTPMSATKPRIIELAGPATMTYKDMLSQYRAGSFNATLAKDTKGKSAQASVASASPQPAHQTGITPVFVPVPWWFMMGLARVAHIIPFNNVLSIDTMRMLRAESISKRNETNVWLGRNPTSVFLRTTTPPVAHRLPATNSYHID